MGRIGNGWALTKMSLRVIRKDKELLLFPLISGLASLLILVSFFAAVFLGEGLDSGVQTTNEWEFAAFFIAFYFVTFFLTTFFNTAVIGCATIRMNGGNPTVRDGFRIAMANLKQIVLWSLFGATVGLILRAIQQRVGFIGKIVVGALGAAYSIATYFVVPVFVYERLGPWAALKRSVSLMRSKWGEALVGNLGMGAIFVLLGLLGIVPIIVGALLMTFWSVVIGVLIAVIYWVLLGLIASAAESVLVAALYRYATTGKTSEEFSDLSFQNPGAPISQYPGPGV